MVNLYRGLIIISLATYALWWFEPYIFDYESSVMSILLMGGYGAKFQLDITGEYLFTVWFLISCIGLWFYQKWARASFTTYLLFSLALAPFGGVSVYSGFSNFISSIGGMADSILLFMAYFSTISIKFNQNINQFVQKETDEHVHIDT